MFKKSMGETPKNPLKAVNFDINLSSSIMSFSEEEEKCYASVHVH